MDNIDLNINNYSKQELQHFFKLNNTYSNTELNSQITKFTLKIINNNYPNEYKEKILFFINNAKDKLQIKNNNDNAIDTNKDYTTVLSDIIDTKIGNIIKSFNISSHNPLNYQKLNSNIINPYQEKTTTINYVFNTKFRNDFLNSIPQQSIFYLPESLNNVVKISLVSIQIPNVMFAFSNAKFTTQLYIKEDITNYAAIVVIPEGNYDETSFPIVLRKCINEQVINPYILPVNYRFDVTIDPYTFFITIKNSFYKFTMETITKYPSTLGNCTLSYQLSSTNLTVYQTYNTTLTLNDSDSNNTVNLNYNSKNIVTDLLLENSVFTVNKYYKESIFITLERVDTTLKSLIKGSLVLDYDLNKVLDIMFQTNNTDVLYVPLEPLNFGYPIYSTVTNIPTSDTYTYYFNHSCVMTANLLKAQVTEISTNTSINETTKPHKYTLKIYNNKKFELIQNVSSTISTIVSTTPIFDIYDNIDLWKDHNINNDAIGYDPFSIYTTSFGNIPNTTSFKYIKTYTLYQMITGNLIVSHDPVNHHLLNFSISMNHYPSTPLLTFPVSTTPIPTPTPITTKQSNLTDTYNFRFNDLDVKGVVSEISISNTLGYQIGYRSINYSGLKSYTSESTFNKTSLDYLYFCVDDYNKSYLNNNYGILPNANILDKNILAIITIRSSQFTTTFDNGSDYIPKLRYYTTPVNITKIGIRLLDPLGNLVNINTNDFSFVLEITKLIDITNT
jgi:hypothetical protein